MISTTSSRTLPHRFEQKFQRSGAGDCWEWQGSKDVKGYGRIGVQVDGRSLPLLAHRVAYELATSSGIPDGKVIDYLCRNTSCVNPAHLDLVTQRENVRRGVGIVAVNMKRDRCPRGHAYDRFAGGRRCRRCDRATSKRYQDRVKANG